MINTDRECAVVSAHAERSSDGAMVITDETIAKRLGVSPRTARRIANTLMTRLGARSRFQAGAMAVQVGRLPDQPGGTPSA
ncbi:hypothetical protein [Streptomyces sp. NPDC006134]|uniref:hypothetical protein n=1 Tax=Streptomyces sp. NPDC006134 TaxID=3154467 RepID=UPI0033E0CED9